MQPSSDLARLGGPDQGFTVWALQIERTVDLRPDGGLETGLLIDIAGRDHKSGDSGREEFQSGLWKQRGVRPDPVMAGADELKADRGDKGGDFG